MALAAVLLISGSAIARADSISISEELTLTGLNDASVTQAVENYFDERADYLLGDSAAIDGTVVASFMTPRPTWSSMPTKTLH